MKLDVYKQKANLIRDNETYKVYDMDAGHLVLSLTELHASKATSGHSHDDADEVYYCISGNGSIQIGQNASQEFSTGDVYHIPRGDFHKVFNASEVEDLVFMCIFEKYGDRK